MESHTVDNHGEKRAIGPVCRDHTCVSRLENALSVLSNVFPEFSRTLAGTTVGFVLFSDPGVNSFAADALHGLSFLSVPRHCSVPYFVEDVLHQCGHIMFSSMCVASSGVFLGGGQTPISTYTRNRRDTRSVSVVWHAVFTEYLIAEGLLRCLKLQTFTGQDEAEAMGRLTFVLKKSQSDLRTLYLLPSSDDELKLRESLSAEFARIVEEAAPSMYLSFDIGDQPYNFDFDLFREHNGLQPIS
jgi:hypothetical protein